MNEPLSSILNRLLPPEAGEELRRNIDAAIQGYLERMNLATREQLEVQEKILRRTRERLEKLERRLQELEEKEPDPDADH